ncbi:unnamed protein product [Owenia fusiformis]|uniref:Uncharacterized protein n=1 Tax=Owenia fusiformis TaxID=6347 RepID=A0A8J1T4V0_OWEFU|nr:unnamed protein product [Owenia fusiformis]
MQPKLCLLFAALIVYENQQVFGEKWDSLLQEKLFTGYMASSRPQLNETTNLTMGMSIRNMYHLDERNKLVKLSVWFRFYWNDIRLLWNPKDYGNITRLHLKTTEVWTPDIVLHNSLNEEFSSLHEYANTIPVIVHHNGDITWLFPGVIKTSCDFEIALFPFDTQKCALYFGSWTYNGNELNTYPMDAKRDTQSFTFPNGEWIFMNFEVKRNVMKYLCCPEPYVDIQYVLTIKRKPLFHILNLIVPCSFLLILSTLGFLMPITSGSRAPLAIMVLLSMTVLQVTVSDTIPRQSDYIPLISQYIGFILVMMVMNVILTILSLNIHYNGPQFTNSILIRCFKSIGRCFSVHIENKIPERFTTRFTANDTLQMACHINEGYHNENEILEPTENSHVSSKINQLYKLLHKMRLEKHELTKKNNEMETKRQEWIQIAMIIDRVFAVTFLLVTMVAFLVIFSQLFGETTETSLDWVE